MLQELANIKRGQQILNHTLCQKCGAKNPVKRLRKVIRAAAIRRRDYARRRHSRTKGRRYLKRNFEGRLAKEIGKGKILKAYRVSFVRKEAVGKI